MQQCNSTVSVLLVSVSAWVIIPRRVVVVHAALALACEPVGAKGPGPAIAGAKMLMLMGAHQGTVTVQLWGLTAEMLTLPGSMAGPMVMKQNAS